MPNLHRNELRIRVSLRESLDVRRVAGLEMRVIDSDPAHRSQAAILQEWNRLRRHGLPSRNSLSPACLAPIANHMYICDRRRDGPNGVPDYRFRYVGTELADLYGDPTGRLLSEFAATPWAKRVLAANEFAVEMQEPVAVFAERIAAAERGHLSSDTLCLPLSDDGTSVSAVLTVMNVSFRREV